MYATFNVEKVIDWRALMIRDRHNRRLYNPPNADPERYKLNVHSKNKNGDSKNVYRFGRHTFEETQMVREEAGARKNRENAVKAVEVVLGASADFFRADDVGSDGKSPKIKNWVNANLKWARDYYKDRGKILGFSIHYDESWPHIHIMFAPISQKIDKSSGKNLPTYNAKEFVGNKTEMKRARTSHADAMKSFGLERGREKKWLTQAEKRARMDEFRALTVDNNPVDAILEMAHEYRDNDAFSGELRKINGPKYIYPFSNLPDWNKFVRTVPAPLVPYLDFVLHSDQTHLSLRRKLASQNRLPPAPTRGPTQSQ